MVASIEPSWNHLCCLKLPDQLAIFCSINLAPDITANCICEIHCLALDWFDLNTVHKLSSQEKKSRLTCDSNSGLQGGKQECFHCAMQPPNSSEKILLCCDENVLKSWKTMKSIVILDLVIRWHSLFSTLCQTSESKGPKVGRLGLVQDKKLDCFGTSEKKFMILKNELAFYPGPLLPTSADLPFFHWRRGKMTLVIK